MAIRKPHMGGLLRFWFALALAGALALPPSRVPAEELDAPLLAQV